MRNFNTPISSNILTKWTLFHGLVRHFHISHNAPYSPPKIVHKDYFQFLLGRLPVISRRNEKQRLCKIWGANKVHYPLQLCKSSTSSRVCITVSNSPNPFRVYIRLCKHGKRFLLLNYSTSACWIWVGSGLLVGYNHLISNEREWNDYFIKNTHKTSRILPDFICKNNRFSACF